MSDLGPVLYAPEEGHGSQRFVPPHQSRLAGRQQAKDGNCVECRSAERAIKEVELDLWPRRGVKREGGAGLGHRDSSLWGGVCAMRRGFCRTRIMEEQINSGSRRT